MEWESMPHSHSRANRPFVEDTPFCTTALARPADPSPRPDNSSLNSRLFGKCKSLGLHVLRDESLDSKSLSIFSCDDAA
jgi:hypothetical protein